MDGELAEPTDVRTYAGGRGGEVPRAFLRHGTWVQVAEVLRRWIEEQVDPARGRRFWFRVRVGDGETCDLYYDETLDTWYLVPKDSS